MQCSVREMHIKMEFETFENGRQFVCGVLFCLVSSSLIISSVTSSSESRHETTRKCFPEIPNITKTCGLKSEETK